MRNRVEPPAIATKSKSPTAWDAFDDGSIDGTNEAKDWQQEFSPFRESSVASRGEYDR